MSKLSEYLKANNISQRAFATRIGVTQGAVSGFSRGMLSPSLATALRIENETGGKVRPSDLPKPVTLGLHEKDTTP